jgi:hypothetical protein
MPDQKYPQFARNSLHPQFHGILSQRPPRGGVGQDKGASDAAPTKRQQPAPVIKVVRLPLTDTAAGRGQNHLIVKERKVRGSIWLRPGVPSAPAATDTN